MRSAGLQRGTHLVGRCFGVHPDIDIAGFEDHGHAVVDRFDGGVGGAGEEREGLDVCGPETLPQAGDEEREPGRKAEVVGLFFFRAERAPLVEAADGDEAAAFADGVAEGRFVEDGFGASVDEGGPDLFVGRPRGDEAPAEIADGEIVLGAPDDGGELRGSDVEAGAQVLAVLTLPALLDLIPETIGEPGALAREGVERMELGPGVLTGESAAPEILERRGRSEKQEPRIRLFAVRFPLALGRSCSPKPGPFLGERGGGSAL